MDTVEALARAYHEEAVSKGNDFAFGERVGLVRSIHIVDSRDDLLESVEKYDVPVWRWYEPFGFTEVLRQPGEEGPVPKPDETLAERLISAGLVVGGTVDEVKRQMEGILERVPFEYLIWLYHWGIYEEEYGLRQLELFAREIAPNFGFAPPEEVKTGAS
jgi:alkanesulfonate monooxygenase SsuD/methylene tetrahydromethanopterin reductase-like flavin-dependent oxidoreductase (luciferase family)